MTFIPKGTVINIDYMGYYDVLCILEEDFDSSKTHLLNLKFLSGGTEMIGIDYMVENYNMDFETFKDKYPELLI